MGNATGIELFVQGSKEAVSGVDLRRITVGEAAARYVVLMDNPYCEKTKMSVTFAPSGNKVRMLLPDGASTEVEGKVPLLDALDEAYFLAGA
ncbi:MAG TPA: hypothetical protein VJJ82_03490 [Candidatus Nanoarchaeia archaeon]|nr:hypothetical protein [Candidatus Nanoarchaeia archaeon]